MGTPLPICARTRYLCLPPDPMVAYTSKGYRQFAGLEFSGAFRVCITHNGKPVIEALCDGIEEAIQYHGDPGAVDALHRAAQRWLMHYGHPVVVGAEDVWLRWYVQQRPLGVSARRWLAERRTVVLTELVLP